MKILNTFLNYFNKLNVHKFFSAIDKETPVWISPVYYDITMKMYFLAYENLDKRTNQMNFHWVFP